MTDPGNRLLWRFSPTRLSAEQVRDAMLAVSGELKHRDAGGASVSGDQPFRSLYVKRLRNTPDEVLQCFDAPAGFDSSPDRTETTTPTQALLLSNSDWPLARARAFAKRVLSGEKTVTLTHLNRAYQIAWGRKPTSHELELAGSFVTAQHEEWAKVKPPKPKLRFPDENGLRPIAQRFARVEGFDLGEHALWLQPGSRFERLELSQIGEGELFAIEAVVQLEAIHKDASVNTLVSRWNGNTANVGWSLGVTSEKSRYQPRNLIVQLVGENSGGDLEYEVVASDLRIPLGKPVYIAASVRAQVVEFELRELDDKAGEPLTAKIEHNIVRGFSDPDRQLVIGGRDTKANTHLWDGQLARLDIKVDDDANLVEGGFFGVPEAPIPGSRWRKPPPPPVPEHNPALNAFTDFCHALLSSNEFLYLH